MILRIKINKQKMKENLRQKLIKKLNEMDKNQKNHELETLKLKNKLKKEINIINKNLELNKQILINQIRRKAFKLQMNKETELMMQQIENQQMLIFLRIMRGNLEKNNN